MRRRHILRRWKANYWTRKLKIVVIESKLASGRTCRVCPSLCLLSMHHPIWNFQSCWRAKEMPKYIGIKRRAVMLLQSAGQCFLLFRAKFPFHLHLYPLRWLLNGTQGFLDIEKLIEHRPPLDRQSAKSRPAIPQFMILSRTSKNNITALICR